MDENYYALYVAIVANCAPEEAFLRLKRGGFDITQKIVELKKQGYSGCRIAKMLKMSKSNVQYRYNNYLKSCSAKVN